MSSSKPKPPSSARGGLPAVLEILRGLDPPAREKLLHNLSERDPDLGRKLSENLFTFESLQKISPRSLQTLLRKVREDLLALALRDASDPLRARIFAHISKRQADQLRESLESGPKRPKSEVQKAQASIVAEAQEMEKNGELSLREE